MEIFMRIALDTVYVIGNVSVCILYMYQTHFVGSCYWKQSINIFYM